jgi:hypothetical protein
LAQLAARADARDKIWRVAADEGTAAPQISSILEATQKKQPSEADLEIAWQLAKARLARWRQSLRSAATTSVVLALQQQAEAEAEEVMREQVREEPWLTRAQRVQGRLAWLQEFTDVARTREQLETSIDEATSARVMGTAMDSVRAFPTMSETEQTEALGRISKAFEFQDQQVAPELQQDFLNLLEHFATTHAIIGTDMSQCGVAVAEALVFSGVAEDAARPWTLVSAWQATALAADLLSVVAELESDKLAEDPASLHDMCQTLLKNWKTQTPSGTDCLAPVLGTGQDELKDAVEKAQKAVATSVEKQCQPKREALDAALGRLSQAVGAAGEPSPGGSSRCRWKDKLSEASPWEEVEREASYHLLPGGQHLHTILDKDFDDVIRTRDALQRAANDLTAAMITPGESSKVASTLFPADLSEKVAGVIHEAEVLHTESFFFSLLASSGPDRARKIQKRIESMSARGISSERIQPALWRKVLAVSSSKPRAFPSTPVKTKGLQQPPPQ